MDGKDAQILQELRRDGRQSNVQLAARVGLSPSACLRRVADLEKRGVIKGYRAVLDPVKMGVGLTVFVTVGLSGHLKTHARAFEAAMRAAPEVTEVHNITGQWEYLLKVEATDLAAYKRFHTDTLGTLSMVASITSHICLGTAKGG